MIKKRVTVEIDLTSDDLARELLGLDPLAAVAAFSMITKTLTDGHLKALRDYAHDEAFAGFAKLADDFARRVREVNNSKE